MKEKVKQLRCERCGWEWVARIDRKPKRCPGCSSVKWDKRKTK